MSRAVAGRCWNSLAGWTEIDLDAAMWTVPAARMKRELRAKLHGAPHQVWADYLDRLRRGAVVVKIDRRKA